MNMKARTPIAAAVGAAICLFSLLCVANSFAEGKQDFTLHNDTGKVIKEIYVGPTSSEEWGDDVMGKEVVPDGSSVHITFHPKATQTTGT
jgi:hypothetical protein